ncbi:MAG: NAD-dependent epimerase [Candidatus Melainabacteria bacterium]|nr:MAG: NAD-dependent epimerase [Candidatus Melainabacteria bacterium]
MKALVIGGNGFIGTHLVSALQRERMDVRVFDRYPSKFVEPSKTVEYVIGDLGNHGALSEIVNDVDWVFHLAYTTLPKTSNDDPVYDVRSNLIDTIQLLQECSKAGVNKVVFISSGGTVYGVPKSVPIKESHPTDPFCSYGITKLAIEKYLHVFYHLNGLDYVVLRVSNPYGEGQNPHGKQGAIGVFLGRIAKGEPIKIWGSGEVVRDYIYIEDVATALLAAARYRAKDGQPRIFNIGSGKGISLNELIAEIRQTVEVDVQVDYTPARALDVPVNILDIELAKERLGWQPFVDLGDGLARTWNWVKALDPVKQITLI